MRESGIIPPFGSSPAREFHAACVLCDHTMMIGYEGVRRVIASMSSCVTDMS